MLSHVRLFATPWTAARQASLSFAISWSLLKLMSIESVMPSNHLILRHPLLLPSIFPSESTLGIRWPKNWNFRFISLLTFGCAGCSLLCLGFLFVASGGYSFLWCAGFSLQWPLLLQVAASRHVGFSSRGTQTKSSCGTWDLPRPGMEPMSPASVGRFLTTGPPGNSPLHQFCSRTGLPGFQWASLEETRR